MKLKLAEKFLSRFNYDLTTLQVFPTVINGAARWPKQGGTILATGAPGSTAIAFKGLLHEQPFLPDLKTLQRQRMGVYFMVNEGDGAPHGHKIVRNSKAVHTLKALFVDTDEGNPKKLKQFCKQFRLKPHSIIESSPGKFHWYFLIKELPVTNDSIFKWQSCQHRLAAIDPNYDDSMADLGQVLRVPGFYHTKKEPFLIREIYGSNHPRYDLHSLFDRIGANKTPPRKGSRFTRPQKKISLGQRHEVLTAYLGSVSNIIREHETLCDAGIGFAQRNFSNSSEWLPTGSRYHELRDQVDFVLNERSKEDVANSLQTIENTVTQGFSKLPDDFYLNAPGIVGKIVREICKYSAQPYPSFAFAAACSLVGTLKSPFIRGEYRDTPPSTYFLCLASTGRGKDFPREAIGKVFSKLGFPQLLTQKIRSAQGFLKRLSKAQGIHLFLHDEAHHLFAQIRKGDTDYITTLKPSLLSLFSSANTPVYDCGAVVTSNIDIPPIPYPTLNYCGFGVPTGFEETFQSGELAEGLLTRFLIIRDHQTVLPISRNTIKIPKHFEFETDLREMSVKLRQRIETAILDDEKTKSQVTTTIRKFVQVPIDPEAFELLENYSKRIADTRNTTTVVLDALQSRLVEQAGRLAVILSEDRTTAEIMAYCIRFVDHCYDNVALYAAGFGKGQGNKDLEELINFISERIRISNGPMQAQDLRYFKIRDRHALNNTLELGMQLQKIEKIDNYRKPGINSGRVSTAYIVIGD